MDTRFSSIVTDLVGKDHILIEGRLIEIVGAAGEANPIVDVIVRALRGVGEDMEANSSLVPNAPHLPMGYYK